jgi:hypothetical protein
MLPPFLRIASITPCTGMAAAQRKEESSSKNSICAREMCQILNRGTLVEKASTAPITAAATVWYKLTSHRTCWKVPTPTCCSLFTRTPTGASQTSASLSPPPQLMHDTGALASGKACYCALSCCPARPRSCLPANIASAARLSLFCLGF